jgi:2-polyprenyl-3-methyl-5-hydroxy-6-metoxy-1,4-benzoquinol methylase
MAFEPFLDFGTVPVSGFLRTDLAERFESSPLSLELCASCGIVRQQWDAARRDYSDMTRPTDCQFPAYGDEVIRALKSLGVDAHELVLEIGANDGSFLDRLRAAGFRRLVGVEPSRELAKRARRRGLNVVNEYFGQAMAGSLTETHGAAQAIICRHTLEHVPDPLGFVTALRECLDPKSGIALVEVPDSAVIPEQMNIYEFWDEHRYYFMAENLMLLLSRVGMNVLRLERQPHLDTRNLLAWCGAADEQQLIPRPSLDPDAVMLWQALPARWLAYRRRFGETVRAAPRPLYLIGASHPQCNFANYVGIGALVDYFIDDDPAKVGRFPAIAGGHAPVISTSKFKVIARCGTVLKTGFGYPQWTARVCEEATQRGMEVLDPRDSVAACA